MAKSKHMVNLKGKDYILFQGLLEIAHSDYKMQSIETDIIQLPNEENGREAVIKATVKTEDGKTFTGVGDASPQNVNKMIASHIIRMAETRAIGRALRFLTGFGTMLEELGPDPSEQEPQESRRDKLVEQIRGLEFEFGEKVTAKIIEMENMAKPRGINSLEEMPEAWVVKVKEAVLTIIKEIKKGA
jgi:hypothetical protein